ncbi:hypothetical protein MNBD_ALPHA11-1605 [hydrothermal vent metagenome]|uniref:Uncharacterized protein n=1 Tax=hydrothermal vent metagenome TaxID=652676 RepID=A0A3B0TZT6_9ZZZZ
MTQKLHAFHVARIAGTGISRRIISFGELQLGQRILAVKAI